MSITVIGTVFIDVKAYPYDKYIPNGRNAGYDMQVHGGVARNIAEDLSNIGIDTRFVSLVDDSGTGTDIIEHLKSRRVDTGFVEKSRSGMGKWIAIFDDTGDVAAQISVRAEIAPLTELIADKSFDIFHDTESIILEIDIDEDTVEKVVRYASQYKKKIYAAVSVMSIAMERKRFFPDIEGFACNLQEACMLFGEDISSFSIEQIEKYIKRHIIDIGFRKLFVTLGDKGAVYCDASGNSGHCPAEDISLIDSTGAGDAFCAGAFAALTRGRSLDKAAEIGSKLAGDVISSKGNVCSEYNHDKYDLNCFK